MTTENGGDKGNSPLDRAFQRPPILIFITHTNLSSVSEFCTYIVDTVSIVMIRKIESELPWLSVWIPSHRSAENLMGGKDSRSIF